MLISELLYSCCISSFSELSNEACWLLKISTLNLEIFSFHSYSIFRYHTHYFFIVPLTFTLSFNTEEINQRKKYILSTQMLWLGKTSELDKLNTDALALYMREKHIKKKLTAVPLSVSWCLFKCEPISWRSQQ